MADGAVLQLIAVPCDLSEVADEGLFCATNRGALRMGAKVEK